MKILRPLDALEKNLLKLQLSNLYGCNVHFTVRYYWDELVNLQNSFLEINISQILFPALERVISKTPHLCISIKDAKTSSPQFVVLSEIDFSRVIKFVSISSNEEFVNISEKELVKEFDLDDITKPYWRITVGTNNSTSCEDSKKQLDFNFCIMFTCNHIIGDALSSMAFQATLMEAMDKVFSQRETHSFKLKFTIDQSMVIENPLRFYGSIHQPENNYVKNNKHVISPVSISWLNEIRQCNALNGITKIRYFSLFEKEFEPILLLAKTYGTTILAVLNMLIFFSIRETIGHKLDSQILNVRVPCSLRERITPKVSWREFGNFISSIPYEFNMNKISSIKLSDIDFKEQFWNLCQDYTLVIRSDLSILSERLSEQTNFMENKNNTGENNAKNFNTIDKNVEDMNGEENVENRDKTNEKQRSISLIVSNLGKFPINSSNRKRSNLKVVGLNYSSGLFRSQPPAIIRINSISYYNILYMCVLYQDGSIFINCEQIDKFIDKFLEISKIIIKDNLF
ncbi:1544_t:CDS:1 [Scutellospora calospora]|uniref:1544_t:CDS:1 n=1 Tax=Scutellospora calospora TaxID=85575 RepID=A0ACA9LTJ7_9GLOM|nr:1544_t:CDS:1 [Scutellospora calospora]